MSALTIDGSWWDHLVPKSMSGLRGEVQSHLRRYTETPYGREWLTAARRPGGIFRVRAGQPFPVFHIVFLQGLTTFIAPAPVMRPGHRTVNSLPPQFQSGKSLEEGELILSPQIRIELVTDPVLLAAARAGSHDVDETLVVQPSQIFSSNAEQLLRPTGYPKKSYVLYQHIFGRGGSYPDDGWFYVGITTRSWQKRWAEHRRAIESGSPLLFHRCWRDEIAKGGITYIHHKVMGTTADLEELYASEEFLVEGHWTDARRLNMIPGGKSGLRYMREHGMLGKGVIPMPDERDRIVREWLEDHPRKGLPAPWVAERWLDNDWAVAQICGREGRLSVEQVRAIRSLALHHTAEDIADRIGALNAGQVERVIAGKTYTRVD